MRHFNATRERTDLLMINLFSVTESYELNADFVVQFSSEHWLRPEGAL